MKNGKLLSEKALTRDIRGLLRKHGVFHWKAWQGPMSASGIADIIAICRGTPVAIEIKGNRGKVSEAQERFLERFWQAGGIGFVARTVEDVIKALDLRYYCDSGETIIQLLAGRGALQIGIVFFLVPVHALYIPFCQRKQGGGDMAQDPLRNTIVSSVQEALDELVLSRRTFYRLRRLREIPKMKGQRFITTRKQLWLWLEGLLSCPERKGLCAAPWLGREGLDS